MFAAIQYGGMHGHQCEHVDGQDGWQKQQLHGGQNRHDQCAALWEAAAERQRRKHNNRQRYSQHAVRRIRGIADHLQIAIRGGIK